MSENLVVRAGGAILDEPWGLGGLQVIGTMLIAVPEHCWVEIVRRELMSALPSIMQLSGTELDGVSVFRAIGSSAAEVKAVFGEVWQICRKRLGTDGNHWPRIWAT